MGGSLKLAEKPIEFKDTETPLKGVEGPIHSIGPEPLTLDWLTEQVGPDTFKDGPNLPLFGDTDLAPAGPVNYFTDFSQFAERLADTVSHVTTGELYHAVEGGALRFLERSAPNFGSLGGLITAGLDVFANLQMPGSGRLFARHGKAEFFLGKGTNIGFDRVQSGVMQPKHVKISEGASGLQFEDMSGAATSNVWIGEKVPGSERYEWKRLAPGVSYQPKSEGMVQVAVGPIALDAKGQPKDFKGVEHFGVNGPTGERRIFRME